MDMTAFAVAGLDRDDHAYDAWLAALTEASARLDVLETAITELRRRCEKADVTSEQVLEVLERSGAIAFRARSHAA
ncbi:MAG: hypothetical protein ACRDTV_25080 [Mycobacterium sp.]